MDESKQNLNMEESKSQFQARKEGFYDQAITKLNLTTRKLDIVIAVCIVVLVVSLIHGYNTRGYTVEFNTLGGTTVESQELMYGDLVIVDNPPTREGYEFAGWYTDSLLENPWNLATDTVEGSMTLYAAWEEITE